MSEFDNAVPGLSYIQREGRLLPVGGYSDIVVREDLSWYVASIAGIAAYDATTKRVVGYEPASGRYAADALERQIENIFIQLDALLSLLAEKLGRRFVEQNVNKEAKPYDVSLANLTRVSLYLAGDGPHDFERADEAYREEFTRRHVGVYPTRITTLGHRFPAEGALVEMEFEAAVPKTPPEIQQTLASWSIIL